MEESSRADYADGKVLVAGCDSAGSSRAGERGVSPHDPSATGGPFEDEGGLLRELIPRLRGYLKRFDLDPMAEDDVMQETLVVTITKRRAGEISGPCVAYAIAVARNMVFKIWRRRGRESHLSTSQLDQLESNARSAEDTVFHEQVHCHLKSRISTLRMERDRRLLISQLLDAEKNDVCEELALSPDQFDKTKYRAIRRLRLAMGDHQLG